ncbi:MAG: hypothetical protein PF440_10605 [Thiomicrorhabdus sp.]|jgi:hypothetical protein|nr:hypothetical protein [Thiomicrorhabdus sp.]
MTKKAKSKVDFFQNKSLCRNWSKGIIVGTLKNFAKIRSLKSLSMAEQLKLIKAKKLLEETLADWKPTLK